MRGLIVLDRRLLGWLGKMRGDFLSACSFARPDETSILFIDHRVCEKQLVLQVVKVVVIEVEASFQRTIGDPSLAFEEVDDLDEDVVKGHGAAPLRLPRAPWRL